MRSELRCVVCEGGNTNEVIVLCDECAHPMRVRTYCRSCGHRGDHTILEARLLFARAGLRIDRVGIVLRFDEGCPLCASHHYGAPDIFEIEEEDSLSQVV